MFKVMIVDDQKLLKETLLLMLEQDEEITAFDGGENGYEAIEKCKVIIPDVILMDLRMPKMGGLEAMKEIKKLYPSIKIMILTTFEDNISIIESMIHGADGYIVKDIQPSELILAVKSVHHNLYVMHKNVLVALKNEMKKIQYERERNVNVVEKYDLTPMEITIIKFMVEGKSNKEIAECINFTEGTVKNKVSKILHKLDLKDRTQIAVFAVKNSLLEM